MFLTLHFIHDFQPFHDFFDDPARVHQELLIRVGSVGICFTWRTKANVSAETAFYDLCSFSMLIYNANNALTLEPGNGDKALGHLAVVAERPFCGLERRIGNVAWHSPKRRVKMSDAAVYVRDVAMKVEIGRENEARKMGIVQAV